MNNTKLLEHGMGFWATDVSEKKTRKTDLEYVRQLEDKKRGLLVQAYCMKQEHPHMSPVSLEIEMYHALLSEIQDITATIQKIAGM